jgi:hypothetical protein
VHYRVNVANISQMNSDGDNFGNTGDNRPNVASRTRRSGTDTIGDVWRQPRVRPERRPDGHRRDHRHAPDVRRPIPERPGSRQLVRLSVDNCRDANPTQADSDQDGVGTCGQLSGSRTPASRTPTVTR